MLSSLLETFSDDQAVTVDAISTNVIDLLPGTILGTPTANTIRDIGAGARLYWHCLVTTAFTTSDAGVMTATLESSAAAALTAATVHLTGGALIPAATMVAGYWLAKGIGLPPGDYLRYLGVRYLTTTGDFTAGKVKSWISENRFDDRYYRPGYVTGVN